jgi:hypothetical protein
MKGRGRKYGTRYRWPYPRPGISSGSLKRAASGRVGVEKCDKASINISGDIMERAISTSWAIAPRTVSDRHALLLSIHPLPPPYCVSASRTRIDEGCLAHDQSQSSADLCTYHHCVP